MSPRSSPLSFVTELRHLETYLGATEADIRRLADQVASRIGFVQYIQARNGKRRRITLVNSEELRNMHGRVLELLAPVAEDLPFNVHAFIRGRSIRTNALQHISATFTQKFDLSDFFSQVTREKVIDGLMHAGATEEIADVLASLTTVDGSLPMGFKTSPMLANTSVHAFDADVLSLANELGLTVSRYADDIVFSGPSRFDVANDFAKICQAHSLRINLAKTRSAGRGQRMVVTGLSIANGDRPRLPRAFRSRIRQELHYIARFGLEDHADHLKVAESYVAKRLGGRIAYAKSVDPDWIKAIAARYPEAFEEVSVSGSPAAGAKRTASLERLAARVRERAAFPLPLYESDARFGA